MADNWSIRQEKSKLRCSPLELPPFCFAVWSVGDMGKGGVA